MIGTNCQNEPCFRVGAQNHYHSESQHFPTNRIISIQPRTYEFIEINSVDTCNQMASPFGNSFGVVLVNIPMTNILLNVVRSANQIFFYFNANVRDKEMNRRLSVL